MTEVKRRALIAGNWKLHNTVEASLGLVRELRDRLKNQSHACDVAVAPVFTALHPVAGELRGSDVALGAQDAHWEDEGAFTGEVSAMLLADVGCRFVIVGHSERRELFGEKDADVQRKVQAVLRHGMSPIVCVGETLEEREAGETLPKIKRQVSAGLEGLAPEALARVVVAYEPIWAIGTSKTAEPSDAQEAHAALRDELRDRFSPEAAETVRILYGGSVKPENAAAILQQPDVDGALVGGASLKPDSFMAIIEATR